MNDLLLKLYTKLLSLYQQLLKIMGTRQGRLILWAEGIQQSEGFTPGSRSYRNNNPGNLHYAGQLGTIGADKDGFAIFKDYHAGFAALIQQLHIAVDGQSKHYSLDMSLKEFTCQYAGLKSDTSEYKTYISNITSRLGVGDDIQIINIIV